jgi:N utilization substance protein B
VPTCSIKWSPPMRVESRARARALQAVYAWDMREGQLLDRVAQRVWDDLAVTPEEREFAGKLIRWLSAAGKEIDRDLTEVTTNWRLNRLGAIERSVLRIAAAELAQKMTPPRVVIKESMRLAERYGTPESARFVNGVLDAYARRHGLL